MPILMKMTSEVHLLEKPEIKEIRTRIVNNSIQFYDGLYIQAAQSKFGLMNAVGKLLSLVKTVKTIDWGQVKGYIANVIRNNQSYVTFDTLEALDKTIEDLKKLREKVEGIPWLTIIDGIDYEVFFLVFKNSAEGKKNFILNEFKSFLMSKFNNNLNEIKTALKLNKLDSLNEISTPFNIENKIILDEFWKYYENNKKKSK